MNDAMQKLVLGVENLYPHKLEAQYPRILEKIVSMWAAPQMEEFFMGLMVDERGGRQGFPPEVATELYYLGKVFEGTTNLPKTFDHNPLTHLISKQSGTGAFKNSAQDFISMRAPSDDTPWARIEANTKRDIESKGYPCSAEGFLKAAGAGDIGAVRLFLNGKINVDTCDERGWTPLIIAAFNGREELAQLLIECGAHVSIKDKGGYTPLHWAAFKGHVGIIKQLIIKNADVNARSLRDWTPLIMAALNGHLAACSVLIASGALSGLETHDGWSALQKASLNHHEPVMKLFLSLMKADMHGLTVKK